jgi:hypothetical protein
VIHPNADNQPIVAMAMAVRYPATNSFLDILPLLTVERLGATSVTLFMVKPPTLDRIPLGVLNQESGSRFL